MKHKEKNEITRKDAVVCLRQIYVATKALKHGRNTGHASVLLCLCGKLLSAAGRILKQSV